jgi:hypothetical protein
MRTHDTHPRIVSAAQFPHPAMVLLDGFLIQPGNPQARFVSNRAP